jgi:hypothetical protein
VPARYLLLLTLAMLGIFAGSAQGAPKQGKDFSMVVKSSEPRGFTDHAYTITLKNETGTQQMGSADVTLPSGLTIVPKAAPDTGPNIKLDDATLARGGYWTLDDSPTPRTLHLRALSAPPTGAGATVTVTIDAQMPCSGTALTYSVIAKQSNDFSSNSQDGNMLTLKPSTSNLSTTLEGDCKLRFVNQPKQTERNTQIRADALQPASTNYVSVEAVDGRPLDTAQRMTWFKGEITLAPSVGTFTALSDPTSFANNGEAFFDNIVIDPSGLYTLHASTQDGWVGDSQEFEIPVFVSPCLVGDGNCTTGQKLGKDGTAFTVTGSPTANGGKLVLSPNLGVRPSCAGYNAPSTDFYKFELTQAAPLTAELSQNKANVRKVGGPSGLEVCFASPEDFTGKGGTAPFDYDGNGPLTAGHVGLLLDCADLGGQGPCIDGRTGTAGGGAIVRVRIPPAWSDPMCR